MPNLIVRVLCCLQPSSWRTFLGINFVGIGTRVVYCEKIRVFKAGISLNTLAWNNKIGLWYYFVGLTYQIND